MTLAEFTEFLEPVFAGKGLTDRDVRSITVDFHGIIVEHFVRGLDGNILVKGDEVWTSETFIPWN